MSTRIQICLWASCAFALASCSDDSHPMAIVDAGSDGSAVSTAQEGGAATAAGANCSGQDAITQLLCEFGLTGGGFDGGLGGFSNLFPGLGGTGGLGGFGGAFGGGTMPTAAQCANASDQLTQFLCSLRPDAGANPPGARDAATPPHADAGAPAPYDAGASNEDAGADAGSVVDSGSVEDAGSAAEDAGLADAGEVDASAEDDDAAAGDGGELDAGTDDADTEDDAGAEDAGLADASEDDSGSAS